MVPGWGKFHLRPSRFAEAGGSQKGQSPPTQRRGGTLGISSAGSTGIPSMLEAPAAALGTAQTGRSLGVLPQL